jgi:hypothetical protein
MKLTESTVKNKISSLVIDDLLDQLNNAKFYSKLDLRFGYHQIRMKCEDIPKTTFKTHKDHYEFLMIPFGLINVPTTFFRH